jgi:hypothetical protein
MLDGSRFLSEFKKCVFFRCDYKLKFCPHCVAQIGLVYENKLDKL